MVNSINNDVLKQVNMLFLQAEEEERKYNWENAIELLKKVEKISVDEKLKDIGGKVCYRLGEICYMASEFEKTEEKVINRFEMAISNFEKASIIFKDLRNEEKANASLGLVNLLKYISEAELGKEEILLESAKDYFKNAKLLYLKNENFIESLKIAILEGRTLNLIIGEKGTRIDKHTDLIKLASEQIYFIEELWKQVKKQQNLPEMYLYQYLGTILEFVCYSISCLPSKGTNNQYIFDCYNIIKHFIDFLEKSTKKITLFFSYTTFSLLNSIISAFIVDDQFEQKRYLKIAQKWLKMADPLLPKINANSPFMLFYYIRFTNAMLLMYLGFFARDFKRVMDYLNLIKDLLILYFPRIIIIITFYYIMANFLTGALNQSVPDFQRIDFAKKTLNLIELLKNKISIINNPNYKLYNLAIDGLVCTANTILGDLIKDKKERTRHLQLASKIFNDIANKDYPKINNTQIYLFCLNFISRTGILLAKNSLNKSEKTNYYLKAFDLLVKSKKSPIAFFHIENLFLMGDIHYKVGKLTKDDKIFKKSFLAYKDAIDYCKNKGYFNLMGSGYINLAKIEDRLGNFISAAEHYKNAINSFDQAILTLTYTKMGKKIEKLRNYIKAWELIELAKSYHAKEDHSNAQLNYEQASNILKNLREYRFESPYYSAWAMLEKAENLSKQNKHQAAAEAYSKSKNNFEDSIKNLNSYLQKRKSPEDKDRIKKLRQVANIRKRYCIARFQIETARLEGKNGNHLEAAELYNNASSLFENLCQLFSIKREKDELTAIYFLCKAWESMERADLEKKSALYATASELFEKASNIFPESRMKLLSVGNSLYCSALEAGSLFDKSTNLEEKINYYRKIKMHLRDASKNFRDASFEKDAQWALATSTYFDGIWHLIQSDYEIDHSKKTQYLNIATNYLNKALDIFGKAGYKQKREEILKYLKMIRDEKEILTSALNLIEKPEISASSVGISAPACPIEISSSVNIEEMQRTDLQTEAELNWHKRIHHIYLFMPNGTSIYNHPFKAEEDIEPHLVAGGLAGISGLIKEITKSNTKIKIVEQEEMTILLEYGSYLNVALMTEENLITLRNKLKKLIKEVEDFYQEELKSYSGNVTPFSNVGKFVKKIFEV